MLNSKKIRVEGTTLAGYLHSTIVQYDPLLDAIKEKIENGGGFGDIDKYLKECSDPDSVLVIYDGDIFRNSKLNDQKLENLHKHKHKVELSEDFEMLFPSWMHAEALQIHKMNFIDLIYPDEKEIEDCFIDGRKRKKRGEKMSIYNQLKLCAENFLKNIGRDPSQHIIPEKGPLAMCLTKVTERTWYQPKEVRAMIRKIANWTGYSPEPQSLITENNAISIGPFRLNKALVDSLELKGKLAIRKSHEPNNRGDLWILDIDEVEKESRINNNLEGPPVWSNDGKYIAFKMHHAVGENKSTGVYSCEGESVKKVISEIGHQDGLCWSKDKHLYGSGACRIFFRDDVSSSTRSKPIGGLPPTLIFYCIDRKHKRNRTLFWNQKDALEIYEIGELDPQQAYKCMWSSSQVDIKITEDCMSSFSQNGRYIALLRKNEINTKRSLWTIDTTTETELEKCVVRITPPEGEIGSFCWVDNEHIAFMWSRWEENTGERAERSDDVRLWIANRKSCYLYPFIEGFTRQDLNGAVSCHSWYSK